MDVNDLEDEEQREQIDWFEFGDHETARHPPLDRTDYVALFIASLQSVFLPIVILLVILASFGLLFAFLP